VKEQEKTGFSDEDPDLVTSIDREKVQNQAKGIAKANK